MMLAEFVYLPGIGNNQKTGEVVLVRFNTFLKDFHAVTFSCCFGADGSVSFQIFILDDFCAAGRVFTFHHFQLRMLIQKFATLHQGDRVGVDFCQIFPVLIGETDKTVRDAQFVFTDNLCAALSQQFIVVQQTSRNRILDG